VGYGRGPRMSALRGPARWVQSSGDQDSSFSAQRTADGSCVPSQTSASAVATNVHRFWLGGFGSGAAPALLAFAADAGSFAALGG
jgi:hypothetical protein